MKLIDLHKEWVKEKKLNENGLCPSIPQNYRKYFDLFKPTENELKRHTTDGYGYLWWGRLITQKIDEYTEFRQTIVLFICAMNNEI